MEHTRKPTRKILHTASKKQEREGKIIGATVHFGLAESARAEQTLADLRALGIGHVRALIDPRHYSTEGGASWYDWLLPAIARQAELLPCVILASPSVAGAAQAPNETTRHREFLEFITTRFADYFTWIEFLLDGRSDRDTNDVWAGIGSAVADAADWVRQQGKKIALSFGTARIPDAVVRACGRDALRRFDGLGVAGPDAAAPAREHWHDSIRRLREFLDHPDGTLRLWITDPGFSARRHNDHKQLRALLDAVDAPVDRIYWRATSHGEAERFGLQEPALEERTAAMGLRRADGAPTLLFRLLRNGGVERIRSTLRLAERSVPAGTAPDQVLITGGAGFIGSNLAHRLLNAGVRVRVYDNLSRPGAEQNLRWLCDRHGEGLEFQFADVRNRIALRRAVHRATQIFHCAAQPDLAASLRHPEEDYEVNSCGTLNLLEEIRLLQHRPPLVFISTSKVYGTLSGIRLKREHTRYEPEDRVVRHNGIGEDQPLEFRSPFACSKGCAEQYVLNYANTYGIPAMVLRAGSVYGPRQSGNQQHDWIVHFIEQALRGEPITLYGDGLQVRDILYADDLVDALLLTQRHMAAGSGQAYNIGGGLGNTVSLIELIDLIEIVHGSTPAVRYQEGRPDDQRYYVSNISKFSTLTGWVPQTDVGDGIRRLYAWLVETDGAATDTPTGRMAL